MAIKEASRDAPIVIVAADYDPVAKGHVKSLAKPGERITGVHVLQTALIEKRIEILRELLPQAKRFGVLSDVATLDQLAPAGAAARRVGAELHVHQFKIAPYDFEAAFADFQRGEVDAVLPPGLPAYIDVHISLQTTLDFFGRYARQTRPAAIGHFL